MTERPYSRYTRAKTWAALYSQHINAGYALVPYSATNNSIDVIRCDSPEEVQKQMELLLKHAEECADYYGQRRIPEKAPTILASLVQAKKLRSGVVLARSHDYYHYGLQDYPALKLVICALHDSYLHVPVWEMRTNQRYKARETAIAITAPEFDRVRCTQFGHHMLVGALINGDPTAKAFLASLPPRTQSRINKEAEQVQETRYRGRPLAFLTEAERRAIGSKISEGLRRYHQQKRLKAM